MQKNIIFIPPYYEGTSFEDIINGIKWSIEKNNMPISIFGSIAVKKNTPNFGNFDDAKYMVEYINNLILLSKNFCIEKILFIDFFSPGLDIFQYVTDLQSRNIKKGALIHGGSFVPGDLYNWAWLHYAENLWAKLFDILYVPSYYAKATLPKDFATSKIFPWGINHIKFRPQQRKRNTILFPHRLEEDKGVKDFIDLVEDLPDIQFIVVNSKKLDENKYYQYLKDKKNVRFIVGEHGKKHLSTISQNKIVLSTAEQETYGYAVAKSVLSGCIPILPNSKVYPEYYSKEFLYNSLSEAKNKIEKIIKNTDYCKQLIIKLKPTIERFKTFEFTPLLQDFFEI
ncbi:MAG: glycosyltransferase [Candidatus Gracilibacteria bacterium]|jgi:glycosyltransferase involved in cell wall biosynthesis|nr:glycosyltransferase [Candidatus Gracilibacteria bacterium]